MNHKQDLGDLATGVAEMDFEHGLQIGLIDSFRAAVAEGRGAEEARRILDRLMDFTNAHFLAEQLMMRLHNYPGYEGHVQEHDRLVDALKTLQQHLASGALELSGQAAERLQEWLLGHLQSQDRALATFLTKPRSGQAAPGSRNTDTPAFPGVE
jgi:hemerythrin